MQFQFFLEPSFSSLRKKTNPTSQQRKESQPSSSQSFIINLNQMNEQSKNASFFHFDHQRSPIIREASYDEETFGMMTEDQSLHQINLSFNSSLSSPFLNSVHFQYYPQIAEDIEMKNQEMIKQEFIEQPIINSIIQSSSNYDVNSNLIVKRTSKLSYLLIKQKLAFDKPFCVKIEVDYIRIGNWIVVGFVQFTEEMDNSFLEESSSEDSRVVVSRGLRPIGGDIVIMRVDDINETVQWFVNDVLVYEKIIHKSMTIGHFYPYVMLEGSGDSVLLSLKQS